MPCAKPMVTRELHLPSVKPSPDTQVLLTKRIRTTLSKPVSVPAYKPRFFLFVKTVPIILPTASHWWCFLDGSQIFLSSLAFKYAHSASSSLVTFGFRFCRSLGCFAYITHSATHRYRHKYHVELNPHLRQFLIGDIVCLLPQSAAVGYLAVLCCS